MTRPLSPFATSLHSQCSYYFSQSGTLGGEGRQICSYLSSFHCLRWNLTHLEWHVLSLSGTIYYLRFTIIYNSFTFSIWNLSFACFSFLFLPTNNLPPLQLHCFLCKRFREGTFLQNFLSSFLNFAIFCYQLQCFLYLV